MSKVRTNDPGEVDQMQELTKLVQHGSEEYVRHRMKGHQHHQQGGKGENLNSL